ncbi:RagB/SusD family nutrient uptake outer membrane protein [Pedobacter sp. GR22-6]|uniref:RagB/SusD family nutrient uptake outer membrane protein n=1 Tax=Pedobacter sp. GR22-6 TaxID=3127957 RepID=UPI00307FB4B0
MRKQDLLKISFSTAGILLLLCFSACKKLIEINPSTTQLLTSSVFTDSATVQGTISGVYSTFAIQSGPYRLSLATLPGFSADELQYVGNNFDNFTNNAILSNDGNISSIWSNSYATIYVANSLLEGVATGTGFSDRFKNQATAEARFIRSYCYFYLVNLFGDVPLVVSTDAVKNASLPRSPAAAVYTQMLEDFKFAQANLPADYSISGGARTRVNKWAATAMLARVYLYLGDWPAAEAQSTSLISNASLFELNKNLNNVFAPTSKEAIFQLYNDLTGYTWYANTVLPNPVSKVPQYVTTTALNNSFEAGDARKEAWTASTVYNGQTYFYPYKYKSLVAGANSEYYTLLRLAEQFLIRAEARVQQNNFAGAREDLFAIRDRATLGALTSNDKNQLLLAVEKERRIELNNEWGHRWLDLKRTSRINTVLGAQKPGWKADAALYPIPEGQRTLNRNLTQNLGYN